MNIETKYSIGDTVWYVRDDLCEKVLPCETCGDKKEVEIKGTSFKCPSCVTSRNNTRWKRRHFVAGSSVVGRVSFEATSLRYEPVEERREYMLESTGVGSGSVWKEALLFPTREDAQAYCDALNLVED